MAGIRSVSRPPPERTGTERMRRNQTREWLVADAAARSTRPRLALDALRFKLNRARDLPPLCRTRLGAVVEGGAATGSARTTLPREARTAVNATFGSTIKRIVNFTGSLDSPLEGTGFEPSVPLFAKRVSRLWPAGPISWTGVIKHRSSRETTMVGRGPPPPRPSLSRRDRWFESIFLQRRVYEHRPLQGQGACHLLDFLHAEKSARTRTDITRMPAASRGTDGSNPAPSSRESANFWFL